MRRSLFFALFAVLCLSARAGQLPLTAKEVGLMLRAGYSNASILKELGKRRFADTVDGDKETALLKAGASQELIEALERGSFSVSAAEAEKVEAAVAANAARRAAEAEQSRRSNEQYQSQIARARNAKPGPMAGPNVISEACKGSLVHLLNGAVVHTDEDALANKKLIALYFSAEWCGPCRKFTPQLVEYYNRIASQHPEFEVIFVSNDRTVFGMQSYMRDHSMPWQAIEYSKIGSMGALRKYAGEGIPCLVLVDSNGKILSDSYDGKEYRGPQKVLEDLDGIFARGGLAANR